MTSKTVKLIEEANAQYRALSDSNDGGSFDKSYAEASRAFNAAWRAFTDAETATPETAEALRVASKRFDKIQTESRARDDRFRDLRNARQSTLRRLKHALFEELGILLDPSEQL